MELTGRLENSGLEKILEEIRQNFWSGTIRLHYADNEEAFLLFAVGRLLTCFKKSASENLATELIGFDFIDVNRMQEALKICHDREERLEKILLEQGFFTEEALQAAYQAVLAKRLRTYLDIQHGEYSFQRKSGEASDIAMPELALGNEDLYWPDGADIADLFSKMDHVKNVEIEIEINDPVQHNTTLDEDITVDLDRDLVGTLAAPPEAPDIFINWGEDLGLKGADFGDLFKDEMSFLSLMLRELYEAGEHADVTLLLLRYASHIFSRGILFKIEGDELFSFGEFGFEQEEPEFVEAIQNLRMPSHAAGIFSEAIRENRIIKRELTITQEDRAFFDHFQARQPKEIFVAPIVSALSQGKPAALLYGDHGPLSCLKGRELGIEIFLSQIGVAMEKKILLERLEELAQMERDSHNRT